MDPIKMHRETIKIEGDRNLYNYTFEIEDEPAEQGQVEADPKEHEG